MKAATTKRARDLRAYSRLRAAYLETWPHCRRCSARSTEIHHQAGRSGWRLLDVAHWMPLCHNCHQWATEHPQQAVSEGWSLPRHSIGCQRCDGTGSIRVEGGMPDEVVYDECPACAA